MFVYQMFLQKKKINQSTQSVEQRNCGLVLYYNTYLIGQKNCFVLDYSRRYNGAYSTMSEIYCINNNNISFQHLDFIFSIKRLHLKFKYKSNLIIIIFY